MSTPVLPYPLAWPEAIPRTAPGKREKGAFRTQLKGALENVKGGLIAFGKDSGLPVTDIVLSSNVSLGVEHPADPGVAAWFKWGGDQIAIPIDRYTTPEANLQAVFHILEARRTEIRHGTLALVRASFQGLRALPAPPGSDWPSILGLPRTASRSEIEAAFVQRAKLAHPDKPGGSTEKMAALTAAKAAALGELEFV